MNNWKSVSLIDNMQDLETIVTSSRVSILVIRKRSLDQKVVMHKLVFTLPLQCICRSGKICQSLSSPNDLPYSVTSMIDAHYNTDRIR